MKARMRVGVACASAVAVCAAAFGQARAAEPAPAAAAAPKAPAAAPAPMPSLDEARPPLPAVPEGAPVPWERHLELGLSMAIMETPSKLDGSGKASPVRLLPG